MHLRRVVAVPLLPLHEYGTWQLSLDTLHGFAMHMALEASADDGSVIVFRVLQLNAGDTSILVCLDGMSVPGVCAGQHSCLPQHRRRLDASDTMSDAVECKNSP
jgi:hypothetical protein